MNSLWWLALPVLALPVLWHRQKREETRADPLATARFLPKAEPKQVRVWRWRELVLLLVRCLLLATAIAWLADPVIAWRGDTVVVVEGVDAAWAQQQIGQAGFGKAEQLTLPPAEALNWLHAHEREWRDGARLLVVGDVPMPAAQPRFGRRVELRTMAEPFAKTEHHVAIFGEHAGQWRALFAALDGPQRFVIDDAPNSRTELIVWDRTEAPPAGLKAPLWWVLDTTAFPELKQAREVAGIRYADSTRGRLWTSAAWPPQDADSARELFETWQHLHYPPVAYTAPPQVLGVAGTGAATQSAGALRDKMMLALVALFALERILTHARRR
ncbi:hypothetical protein E4O92_02395 [Massilia horti]|uniref:N-terminal double-transmembrane domain-containing protein n=1 Tax=Massilia horti TaxID=2562153 RepID=A0A4Y9T4R3_9BURK|nr:BatA domain-containing protein [Massilia horti]TFW35223.1 hypothetical protein E4O92_02395 [Massilia horti]